jgi:tetratricopeptide (TPR) repeat protein
VAGFAGIRGSKAKGIELLEEVAGRGKRASDDARVLLVGIYAREKKLDKAMAVLDYLSGKYPRNYLFGIERAAMLYRLGRGQEGARAFADLRNNDHIAAVAKDVVNYQFGEALAEARNYDTALETYGVVVDWPHSDSGLATLAHLRIGQAFDALGKRAQAVKEYNWVLKNPGPDVYDSRVLAKKYREKAYVPNRR